MAHAPGARTSYAGAGAVLLGVLRRRRGRQAGRGSPTCVAWAPRAALSPRSPDRRLRGSRASAAATADSALRHHSPQIIRRVASVVAEARCVPRRQRPQHHLAGAHASCVQAGRGRPDDAHLIPATARSGAVTPPRHTFPACAPEGLVRVGLHQVGIRASTGNGEEARFSPDHGARVYEIDEIAAAASMRSRPKPQRARQRRDLLTIDVDAIDPAFARHGLPSPGRRSARAIRLLRRLAGLRLVGMDVVASPRSTTGQWRSRPAPRRLALERSRDTATAAALIDCAARVDRGRPRPAGPPSVSASSRIERPPPSSGQASIASGAGSSRGGRRRG